MSKYTITADSGIVHAWTGYTEQGRIVARTYCGAYLSRWAFDTRGPWPMSSVTCQRCKAVIRATDKELGRKESV